MLDFLGIGRIECAVLLVNCALLGGWPLLNLLAQFGLRGRGLDSTTQVLWALLIVAVPFLAHWHSGSCGQAMVRKASGLAPASPNDSSDSHRDAKGDNR